MWKLWRKVVLGFIVTTDSQFRSFEYEQEQKKGWVYINTPTLGSAVLPG